jgi:hypothetical protein
MGDRERWVVIYTTQGATFRFERCWNVMENEIGIQFFYKELEVRYFATFRADMLAGWSVEQ